MTGDVNSFYGFGGFNMFPKGGTLLLRLLNMYVSYWSWGGGPAKCPQSGGRVTTGARPPPSFIWGCLLSDVSLSTTGWDCLIYHWPHIWKFWMLALGPSHTVTSSVGRHCPKPTAQEKGSLDRRRKVMSWTLMTLLLKTLCLFVCLFVCLGSFLSFPAK